jgi:hypothetical protein
MTTLDFLRAILPSQGVYYVGLLREGRTGVAHIPCTSIEAMVAAIEKFDGTPGVQVYHACGSYLAPHVMGVDKVGNPKKFYRIPENCHAAKALWIDLDCGEEKAAKGHGYENKAAAVQALRQFCQEAPFPAPLLVDSGNGLHAYWPLDSAVVAEEWRPVAETFKSILAHFGVLADPTRTADFASILRPVGSHNKKNPDAIKEVKAKTAAPSYSPASILAALSNIVANHNVEVDTLGARPESMDSDLNDDLTAHAYPQLPTDAALVAEKCQQIPMMWVDGGRGYEHWRGVMGIVSFCEDRDVVAHDWSSKHALYDPAATQQKIDTWDAGPTTCDFFAKCNPSGCDGCPSQGKIKTPLVLGRLEVTPAEQVVEALIEDKAVEVDVPALPYSYHYDNKTTAMVRSVRDKEGTLQPHQFCHTMFYPTTRICQQDGSFSLRVRAHMPDKSLRDFDIPTFVVAVGGQQLLSELGRKEIQPTNNKDASVHITAYMRDSLQRLLQTSKEMNTMTTFGWKANMEAFLLGDRMYLKDGTMRHVILGGFAASKSASLPEPRGTTQGWSEAVDFLYNRDGMQPLQYAICSGFGSILTPFGGNQYHGIPVALTSAETGKGKTTACMVSLYAFGDAEKLKSAGPNGATLNARWAMMAALNNIPMLFDELTNMKPEDLSVLMYGMSHGTDKDRLRGGANGVEIADSLTWDSSCFITANSDLGATLAMDKGNTQAEAVRFIEIKTDEYPTPVIDTLQVEASVAKIARNAGSAGESFVKYVVTHMDEVTAAFVNISERLAFSAAVMQNAKFRYYRNHAACTLVAAELMHKTGIMQFDLEALFNWTVAHISRQCVEVIENNSVDGQEAMNRMINDLSPWIITTAAYKDGRGGGATENPPKLGKPPVGRYIMGTSDGKEVLAGRLYIVKKDMKDWCLKNRVPVNLILDYAQTEGVLILDKDDHFTVGRGTENATGSLRCHIFDYHRMQDAIAGIPKLTLHSNPNPIKESAA